MDELRTDFDRTTNNYFFYKSKEGDKYEGVVAIDLEQMVIYRYCGASKDDFEGFLCYPYGSATPQQVTDELCYLARVRNIRELIDDGALSTNNIETIKNLINYDFPKEIKNVSKASGIKRLEKKCLVTQCQRLWEYNQNTIGRDLEL